jgi:hypothetical protein
MTCNTCVSHSFGRKVNPNAAKAMKLKYERGISLGEAWKIVKSGGGSKRRSTKRKSKKRRTRRKSARRSFGRRRKASRISHAKNSLKLTRKKLKRKARKSRRKSRKMSRKFGMVKGPGFAGQTSYSNAYAPYFGASEPFVNASEWFLPVTGGLTQRPQMLMKN